MKQYLSNSTCWSVGYYILALLISGLIYIAFTDSFCNLIHWLSDTCETRINAIKE